MSLSAAIASHRFGLSEPSLDRVGNDPRVWALGQLRNPNPLDTRGLLTTTEATRLTVEWVRKLRAFGQPGNKDADPVRRETRSELRTHALSALQAALLQRHLGASDTALQTTALPGAPRPLTGLWRA